MSDDDAKALVLSVGERVEKILVLHLGVDNDLIKPAAHIIDDLGADSLDVVELIMAFEEEFDIEIPDDEAEKIETVTHLVLAICRKKSGVDLEGVDMVAKATPTPSDEEFLLALRDEVFTVDFMRMIVSRVAKMQGRKACQARNKW